MGTFGRTVYFRGDKWLRFATTAAQPSQEQPPDGAEGAVDDALVGDLTARIWQRLVEKTREAGAREHQGDSRGSPRGGYHG